MGRGRLEASLSREGARGHRSASKTTRPSNSLSSMGTEAQGVKGPTEKQPVREEEWSLRPEHSGCGARARCYSPRLLPTSTVGVNHVRELLRQRQPGLRVQNTPSPTRRTVPRGPDRTPPKPANHGNNQ